MQRDRSDEPEESQRSRPSSRRSSVSLPRRNSLKRDKDKKTPASPAQSAHSTPKRNARPSLDFMVTGKQILKRVDRANSLPGSSRRVEAATPPRARRIAERAESAASRETSPDMSLDLSQMSDFENCKFPLATSTPKPTQHDGYKVDGNQRATPVDGYYRSTPVESYHRATPVDGNHRATPVEGNYRSTPVDGSHRGTPVDGNQRSTAQDYTSAIQDGARCSPARHKPRSASLQHIQQRVERRTATQQSVDLSRTQRSDLPSARSNMSVDLPAGRDRQELPTGRHEMPTGRQESGRQSKASRDSTFSCSRDSLFKTSSSASPYRYGTDYSSVSPEYSPSSAELSPRAEPSPVLSSCCSHSWAERTMADLGVLSGGCTVCAGAGAGGSRGAGAAGGEWTSFWADYGGRGYDRCPTPYRELDSEFEFADRRARSPTDSIKQINNIIKAEGLRLSPQEAQRVIHCAHLLGSVLSRAVERSHCDDRRRTLTLNLKREPEREPSCEKKETNEMTTQTDISLPNTKSAPRIFENILRQLSKSSLDEPDVEKEGQSEN